MSIQPEISDRHNLIFDKTINSWDEAIPLGNGHLGALVWGPAQSLRLSLDRADIWDTTPFPGIYEEEFSYSNMVKLAREGKEEEIRRIFDTPYNYVTPCKLPAGKLILELPSQEQVQSSLSLSGAEARLCTGQVRASCFVHANRKYGVLRVNCPASQFSWRIENPEFGISDGSKEERAASDSTATASLKKLLYPAPKLGSKGRVQYFVQTLGNGFSYGVFVGAQETRDGTLLVFGVAASCDGEQWKEHFAAELETALETGYEQLYTEHADWWRHFWEKSSISLPDQLVEKNWYLTNYLLASCSRKGGYPMQLQGLWTADDGQLPPWKGDYHHDLNTQLSYYHYLKANHLEEGECFLDFLWQMRGVGRDFAKSFYHTEGMCIPSVMAIDGTALGGWGMYALSPTNQIWLCQAFERYYHYTGDRTFLEEKLYPYLEETAVCILGMLEEREGHYYLPISSSPEIHDDTIGAFLTPNSNYDLALMRWLFTQLTELAAELDNGETIFWQRALEMLPGLAVSKEGVLMLSPDESLEESHRHCSHLMAIHPLRLLDYATEEGQRIIDASILNLELLGTGSWTGYTFAWFAELYAVQKNGNGAAHQLRTFWDVFCSPNGFHLNGDYKNKGRSRFHYRPFTLEGNMCAADALQEMLLQSEKGVVELFPAIPEEWLEETVAFHNLRGQGGLLVSARLEKGRVVSLDFSGNQKKMVKLRKSPYLEEMALRCGWQEEGDCWLADR